MFSKNPSCWNQFCLRDVCATRKDPESETIRNQSHHRKTQDCKPSGRAVPLGSLTLLLSTWAPLSDKVSSLSARVSPQIIHFQVLDKSPLFGPGRSSLSCNSSVLKARSLGAISSSSPAITLQSILAPK